VKIIEKQLLPLIQLHQPESSRRTALGPVDCTLPLLIARPCRKLPASPAPKKTRTASRPVRVFQIQALSNG
jgi:hypothetical protein